MRFFSKNETLGIGLILIFLGLISFYNFRVSLRRARDAQRKDDVSSVSKALEKYNDDFGAFPLSSSDGKIVACKRPEDQVTYDQKGRPHVPLIPCEWGKDSLRDVLDLNFQPYLLVLPTDPHSSAGVTYVYFSNGKRYQIYASLEGKDEDEYNTKIVARSISCGSRICNFGISYGQTPLDKSIEEYENELLEKK